MLNNDIIALLNSLFKRIKMPIVVKELVLWRPVWHSSYYENYEPINDLARLGICDPIWMEFRFEKENKEKRSYEYHIECRNRSKKFKSVSHYLKYADIYPGEDPKKMEVDMEKTIGFLTDLMMRVLGFMCRQS